MNQRKFGQREKNNKTAQDVLSEVSEELEHVVVRQLAAVLSVKS